MNEPSAMPFAPVWDSDCRVLILGSHPSVMSKEAGFYYMNPHNRFWPVMGALLEAPLSEMAPAEKAACLLAHHVALYDVVQSCSIHGSSDASMRDVVPTPLAPLVEGAPIGRILLNGKTAYGLFCRHYSQYVPLAACMPSTSPANARMRLDDLLAAWRIMEEYR